MLARLEKKGLLKHQQDGLRFLYSATTSPAAAKRTALQQYVQTFFGGSLKQMMTALVAEGVVERRRPRRAAGGDRSGPEGKEAEVMTLPSRSLVKVTVILALALAGARLARRSRAAVRHVLLAAGFAALLLLPLRLDRRAVGANRGAGGGAGRDCAAPTRRLRRQ